MKDPLRAIFSFSGVSILRRTYYRYNLCNNLSKLNKFNISRIADIFAPSLVLSYGVGRLDVILQEMGIGEVFLIADSKPFIFPDWMWSYKFPNNVIEAGVKISDCVGE